MDNLFQVPATIASIATRVDKTIKITVDTQELSPEQNATLFSLHQKTGWLLFKENVIQVSDVPKEVAPVDSKEVKTPGQRLRATLFVYWKQKAIGGDFDRWYKAWMEGKIEEIKRQLVS